MTGAGAPAWEDLLRSAARLQELVPDVGERDPVATQVVRQLSEPCPYDLTEVDLRRYRALHPRWQEWDAVAEYLRGLAVETLAAYESRSSTAGKEDPGAPPTPRSAP